MVLFLLYSRILVVVGCRLFRVFSEVRVSGRIW